MKEVAVYEAKVRLSELLTEVQQGAEITITRHGQAVARLVPALPASRTGSTATQQRKQVREAFAALALQRRGTSLDMPIRDAIGHGRD